MALSDLSGMVVLNAVAHVGSNKKYRDAEHETTAFFKQSAHHDIVTLGIIEE